MRSSTKPKFQLAIRKPWQFFSAATRGSYGASRSALSATRQKQTICSRMCSFSSSEGPPCLIVPKAKAFVQARANLKSGVKSPLSAVRKALRYSFLASPGAVGSLPPQENSGCPHFTATTSATRRAWRPLPFGKGWITTSS